MVMYWNKLININDNRLNKVVFTCISKCNSNCSSEVKHLLNATDYNSGFDNYTTCNYNDVYEKCVSNFNERWKVDMTLKPKLRTYIKIHKICCFSL